MYLHVRWLYLLCIPVSEHQYQQHILFAIRLSIKHFFLILVSFCVEFVFIIVEMQQQKRDDIKSKYCHTTTTSGSEKILFFCIFLRFFFRCLIFPMNPPKSLERPTIKHKNCGKAMEEEGKRKTYKH